MKLYRAFATVGGLTMVSRVLGFVRDILIAATLGSGAVADAFFVAFRFPNLFRRLFGEGAFNSAFIPLFAGRLEKEGREAARKFAEESLAGLVFVLLLLTAVAEIAMPFLMLGLAPGFQADPAKFDLAVLLTRITMPYLLCMSVVALLSGVLNSVGKFVESSAVSIVLNLTMMAATLIAMAMGLSNEPLAGVVQAWGVFAAGVFQLLLLIDGARRNGLSLRLRWPRMTEGVRRLVSLGIPGVIAGGVTQLNIVIGTVIASLQSGAVSHLYYADRIYELPLAHRRHCHRRRAVARRSAPFARGQPRRRDGQPEPIVRVRHAADHAGSGRVGRSSDRHCARPVSARRLHRSRHATHCLRARNLRSGLARVRHDQGVLAGLFRARGYGDADALRRHQSHRQYAGVDRPVLPLSQSRPDAASGHRRRDHALAAGSMPACFTTPWSRVDTSSPTRG